MLDMSLFSGEIRPRQYMHLECLRVFLVVPWLDFFLHPTAEIAKTFHVKFCTNLSDVKEDHMDCLNQWWLDVPVRHFRRLVVGLVAGLQALVNEGKREVQAYEILLSTLNLLHSINGASNRISHDTFYINNLAEKVDVQHDYVNWVQSEKTQKQTQFFWMKYPFVMNSVAKEQLLHVDSKIQQHMASMETNQVVSLFGMNLVVGDPFFTIEVRRDRILDDTLAALLNEHPSKMQKPMRVTFRGEEAEDHGGVRKEFFMILFERLLNPDFGMFTENEESRLSWFSAVPGDENSFNLVGILTALAIYNEILVPFPFPIGMFKLFLRRELTLEDLLELSPTEGKGLQSLLDYEGDDVEEVFCLTFTISFSVLGENFTVPLKNDGDNISVTNANRQEYVNLYVQKRMSEGPHDQIAIQSRRFCEGFFSIISNRVVNLFQPRELMELVIGNENYDWDLFKKIMQYKGVYHAGHPTIVAFWGAFFELTVDERKVFLQFLTGTYRLPVHGFTGFQAAIQPTASHLLPVAHTCFNLLDLPDLPDKKEQLRRLRVSIQQPTGFSLV
ncbi:hypothetical protein PMAYCL1PPCAC_21067 [Pristionchus mayeri]|uniref:HECT-type E3 ubiquitin transferase n=1 Tax=Pristionchus mayeri TaxID=1317129 RepID=A0AAN5CVN0_9BILA|nr:hypothetical protein PMAYCL1PPCAC_21067 [Pristionchus mayeri]